jgi:hypothetical protein
VNCARVVSQARDFARELAERIGGAAGTLFGRDGFDDQAAGRFGSRGDSGVVECSVHEGNDFEIVESGRAFKPNVTSNIAASEKVALGIGNTGARREAQADVAGIESHREDGVSRALVGNETDHQSVVIVVDHFEGAGEALAHFA